MNTMNQENHSAFKFPERASYELGYLLRALPQRLGSDTLTKEQQLEVEAADLHAMNCTSTLPRGLQGLGHVLWSAGMNNKQEIGTEYFASVGLLVGEIALQLQFLDEFRQSVVEYELRTATATLQKGRSK